MCIARFSLSVHAFVYVHFTYDCLRLDDNAAKASVQFHGVHRQYNGMGFTDILAPA